MVLEAEKLPEKFLIDPPREGGHGQNLWSPKVEPKKVYKKINKRLMATIWPLEL